MSYNPINTQGLWPWFLQRVSATFLVIGLLAHFWVLHFSIEKPLDFKDVWVRFRTPGWMLFDVLLLVACLYHGLNGMFAIVQDYVPKREIRTAVGWILVILGILGFIWGVYVLAPFARLTPRV